MSECSEKKVGPIPVELSVITMKTSPIRIRKYGECMSHCAHSIPTSNWYRHSFFRSAGFTTFPLSMAVILLNYMPQYRTCSMFNVHTFTC